MYKEFDSIFHEETIIYEDKSDIQRQYAERQERAREASKNGHNSSDITPSKMAKYIPKRHSRSENGFTNNGSTRNRNEWSKEKSDTINNDIADDSNKAETRKQKRREFLKKSEENANKKVISASALLNLDFDLI